MLFFDFLRYKNDIYKLKIMRKIIIYEFERKFLYSAVLLNYGLKYGFVLSKRDRRIEKKTIRRRKGRNKYGFECWERLF